ncbi:hypothetical protein CHS0354_024086 [Potamilus streckersoni]|uniref:Major facilitator superfamily (MFS) profile domain-containing protein n=1 Tax=Potamilus streckersoni TaxID=2493646 RepID=A0AAE0RZM1_9BIVA|nr:hypothetical protein CHS0354_024086 [Potamilus streckersoni]
MTQNSSTKGLTKVIAASSVGTLIEWYDFYIFGSLATIIATKFFPAGNQTLALISTLATFAAGFVVRPFGALFFGRLGDLIGRKYTFMVTLLLMGGATFVIGIVPSYESIGVLAPILILILRLMQGLALGGEYGGAATYVAEHSPVEKRGFWTSWIQTTATVGLFVSLLVIYFTRQILGKEAFEDWGWRVPFLISIFMVAISYYIRKGMEESPLFKKVKSEGKHSVNPLKESFGHKYNFKFVLLALLGATMGQGVIWYTGQFYAMGFMKTTMAVESDQVESIITWALLVATPLFVVFATLSDKVGRKWIMLGGMLLGVILYRPIYEKMYQTGNLKNKTEVPEKSTIMMTAEAVMKDGAPTGDSMFTTVTSKEYSDGTKYKKTEKQTKLSDASKPMPKPVVTQSKLLNDSDMFTLILMVFLQMIFVTMAYGPIAAYLVELFPTKIRYTSMSLPYHIGNGIFGGLLPAISTALTINAKSLFDKFEADKVAGLVPMDAINPNSQHYLEGLWYPIVIADLYTALIKITLTDIKLSKIKKSFIHKAVFDYPHHRMRQLQMKGKDPENGLENHYEPIDETHGIAVGWKKDGILEQEQHAMPFSVYSNMQPRMLAASAVGQGGSLARFAIIDEFLYALNSRELILFKLNANAKIWSRTHLSWGGIETIFTIQNRLFIGSETGMFTYDISNKGNPKFLSQVQHFRSCDPVVANEKFAYVTLRGGTRCFGNTNELQIIDLMQIDSPKVVSRFALAEPYGLALNNNTLFVCDGESGLKIFDVTDKKKPSIIHYLHDLTPLDIILLGNTAIVVAKEGMFQYDITNTTDLVLLSHIPIH